jgi:hypothetical protein
MTPQNKPDLPDPEQVRLINALEYARQVRREIQAASGDVGFRIDLVDLIQKMRDERDNELIQRGS